MISFLFWKQVEQEPNLESAKATMKRLCWSDNNEPEGVILATYDVKDYLADKLKGNA